MSGQAEDLKAKTARSIGAVLPLVARDPAVQPSRAIEADEREFEAFKALRKARSDARLVGVRAIRQKKKDEEEAAKKFVSRSLLRELVLT